ncbi:periodic tryptophan protein 1-like protein isoform X2 [Iris pallida]|uniref:Periodic tryptophan protein 1-like protein isoform X2 n=1 Tax=Iris pallida TaxID=29817 RepID=A0AAX6HYZ0_IRIPA|nr:periodic tryptophan protein 1-like protein isoform X2 [Iris pallida]
MIAALCWVPKGVSKIVPEEVPDHPPTEEVEEASEISENEEKDEEMDDVGTPKEAEDEVAHALAAVEALGKNQGSGSSNEVQAIADRLNELMKGYDKEDDVPDCIGSGVGNLYYTSNDMDPYLQGGDDEEEDEIEDLIIKTTDAVIVSACTTEDEYSYLEASSFFMEEIMVSVYEESEGGEPNMYTHQEKILSAYPLCTAWLDFRPKSGDKGNFVAVGSMEPAIEIWDLDLIKEEQPIMVLGGKSKKKKDRKKSSVKYKKGSHRNSVLTLAWNKEFRNVLASGSADCSVKVWNLETAKCVATAEHHTKEAIFFTFTSSINCMGSPFTRVTSQWFF